MKKFFSFLIFMALFIGVVGSLTAGYFGFFPFVSKIMGTYSPKDLGIKYSDMDKQSYMTKSMSKIEEVSSLPKANASIEYTGMIEQKVSFTDEEVTARINNSEWKYFPFSNSQIRFNKDGSMEFSATLETSRIKGFITTVGGLDYTNPEMDKGMEIINKLGSTPPFYAKLTPKATDNDWTVAVKSLQIGNISVPLATVRADESLSALANHVNKIIPNLNVRSFSIEDGKMNVDATVPNVLKVVK